jgi:hypothetical protein
MNTSELIKELQEYEKENGCQDVVVEEMCGEKRYLRLFVEADKLHFRLDQKGEYYMRVFSIKVGERVERKWLDLSGLTQEELCGIIHVIRDRSSRTPVVEEFIKRIAEEKADE